MQILLFTLAQGLLSTITSLLLGLLLSWCLTSSPPGLSSILRRALVLPFLAPSIVGILGFITLFSNNGLLGGALPIYGLMGIVAAHTFFYAPFIATFLWQAWQDIPGEHLQLSRQLGLSPFNRFRYIEMPVLKPYLYTVTWLVFCMSLASFTTVLVLGGGPRSTTLAVALYQSLFNTLDFSQATLFAALQIGLCILTYSIMLLLPKVKPQPTQRLQQRPFRYSTSTLMSLGLTILLLLPLFLIFYEAIEHFPHMFSPDNLSSLKKSLTIAIWVGPLSTFIALVSLVWVNTPRLTSLVGSMFLITPLALFGFAAFWLQLYWNWIPNLLLIIVLNVFLTLPFALHFLNTPAQQISSTYNNLSLGLGMSKWERTRIILLPLLRKPLAQSLGFCSALAAGDLTTLLMFSDYETPGLAALLFQQMGGYRSDEAMATAMLLLILSWGLLSFFHIVLKDRKDVKLATN